MAQAKRRRRARALPTLLEDRVAALGLTLGGAGQAQIRMKTGASTDGFSGQQGAVYSCGPELAVILVGRGYAEPYVEEQPEADAG